MGAWVIYLVCAVCGAKCPSGRACESRKPRSVTQAINGKCAGHTTSSHCSSSRKVHGAAGTKAPYLDLLTVCANPQRKRRCCKGALAVIVFEGFSVLIHPLPFFSRRKTRKLVVVPLRDTTTPALAALSSGEDSSPCIFSCVKRDEQPRVRVAPRIYPRWPV